MEQLLISVVIPVYNAEKTIEKCVQSVLHQSYKNFELLLVDDGSKDKSLSLCRDLAAKDSRIQVFHQGNAGVSSARNYGIRMAQGSYICFIDSDDWVDDDYLAVLLSHMKKGGLSACQLTVNEQREDEDFLKKYSPEQAQISVLDSHGMQGFPVNKLFDLQVIYENQIYFDREITICEDVLFCIQYLKYTNASAYYSGKCPYHYYKTSGGATNSRFIFHAELNPRDLSEVDAIAGCESYLLDQPEIRHVWQVRYLKAVVNTLRTMEAHHVHLSDRYDELLKQVRKQCLAYLRSPYGAVSSKVSVFLSAISPVLELWVWRKMN
jgi:hypothetical protein